jgi:hypothetical protein
MTESGEVPPAPGARCACRWRLAGVLLFLAVAFVAFATVRDSGVAYDEDFRFQGGDAKLAYYKALFGDGEVEEQGDKYPGLFDLTLAFWHDRLPGGLTRHEKGHLLSVAFGLLGLLAAWRLAARLGGERAGFWALLLLAALPRYYGHMYFNPKDIPFAATYLAGIWALVALFSRWPKVTWGAAAVVGLAAGFCMATRIGGLLVLFYYALFALAILLHGWAREPERSVSRLVGGAFFWLWRGLFSGVIALAVLLVFWPAAHRNPFAQVGSTAGAVQQFGWEGYVLMDGHFWYAPDLPVYYVPYWIAVTTPEIVLLLAALAVVLGIAAVLSYARNRTLPEPQVLWPRVLLVFSAAFPLVYLLLKRPVLYDGLRHFLFVLPPLACMAALAFEWLLRAAGRTGRRLAPAGLQAAAAVAVLFVLADMRALHPYQYVYFNAASGGLPAAFGRDETDYWGLAHREAGEWLRENAAAHDEDGDGAFTYHQRHPPWMLEPFLDARFGYTQDPAQADFYVAMTRYDFHLRYPGVELLHVVERQGVPLCLVFRMPEERATGNSRSLLKPKSMQPE